MTSPRRFPPPWSAEETDACFIVRDHNGQALAYIYFEEEPGRRSSASCRPRSRRAYHEDLTIAGSSIKLRPIH